MARLTAHDLNERYPDFEVARGLGSYHTGAVWQVTHKPSGKRSCCLIRTLALAEELILECAEGDSALNDRSRFR
jgi:hypothetical protein